jgi:hypothetical protein
MTQIGIPPRSTDDWDVPGVRVASDMALLVARQHVQEHADRLAVILAHPETAIVPARRGHLAEYAHLMHDADPDSTVPAFRVALTKTTSGRTA